MSLIDWDAGDACLPGANVSGRIADWQFNYRIPDVVLVKAGGRTKDHGTHWVGGPDLVMEVLSDDEEPHAKLDFYASLRIDEVLILNRDPWTLELLRWTPKGYRPESVYDSKGGTAASKVLPVTFRIRKGSARDQLVIEYQSHVWVI